MIITRELKSKRSVGLCCTQESDNSATLYRLVPVMAQLNAQPEIYLGEEVFSHVPSVPFFFFLFPLFPPP